MMMVIMMMMMMMMVTLMIAMMMTMTMTIQDPRESRSEASRELEAFRASRGGGGDVRQRSHH